MKAIQIQDGNTVGITGYRGTPKVKVLMVLPQQIISWTDLRGRPVPKQREDQARIRWTDGTEETVPLTRLLTCYTSNSVAYKVRPDRRLDQNLVKPWHSELT